MKNSEQNYYTWKIRFSTPRKSSNTFPRFKKHSNVETARQNIINQPVENGKTEEARFHATKKSKHSSKSTRIRKPYVKT